jgi:phospholipid/cholesterol/gamma-HCH transport system substrate-binding protein
METRAHHVLIGTFTVAVFVAGALFVLWLGKIRLAREWDDYDIVFQEAVTGLTVGGVVQYNGIQVGEVRKLTLDPEDPRRVIARVRVAGGTPVKTDTKAKLTFTGLTFVAIIQLFEGSPEAPMLASGQEDEVPVIVAHESDVQSFLSSGESILGVAQDVLVRLSILLDKNNLDNVAATIEHVEKLSGDLSGRGDDLGAAIEDLRAAAKSLRRTMARSERLMGRLDKLALRSDALLDDEARRLLVSAARLADNANAVLEQNQKGLAQFSNRDLTQVGPALRDLRATARALRELAEGIEEDPQSMLRGKREKPRERPQP